MKSLIFSLIFFGVFGISFGAIASKRSSPNFIILLTDDVGYGDLSSFGSPNIKTENIDKLAEEGMKFTQWYCPSALCTSSRGSLLTGRLPARLGLYSRFQYPIDYLFRVLFPSSVGGLPENETTIAHVLKQKGYFNALIGKWHLGHYKSLPTKRGFDYFFGTPYSHDEGYPGPFPTSFIWPPVPVYRNEKIIEQPVDLNSITTRMTEEAVNIIDGSGSSGNPFFLVMAYHEAHIPIYAERRFRGTSRRGRYGDMMNQLDWSVGQVMDALHRNNLDQDTFVLFLTDNGAWEDAKEPFSGKTSGNEVGDGGSNGPFREGKGSTWEGGVRGPAIAWWPGRIKAKSINSEVVTHMDVLPTFLDILEQLEKEEKDKSANEKEDEKEDEKEKERETKNSQFKLNNVLDGKSVAPLLFQDDAKTPHEFIFYWRDTNLMAVRYGEYKGHFITRSGFGLEKPMTYDPMLLFNIELDPSEQFPLKVENYPEVVATIIKAAEDHKASVVFAPTEFDPPVEGPVPGQNWRVVPCCKKQGEFDEVIQSDIPNPPIEWGLIIWKNCLCPRGGGGGDGNMTEFFSSPNQMNSFIDANYFYGQEMSYYQEKIQKFLN